MAVKQQTMINCLGKYVRQYFLFKEENGMDPVKIRLRSSTHRVEQADRDTINQMLLQRLKNHKMGLMNPQHKPYQPVAGWPVLNLDELVLNTMADRLDPKVWQAVRSQFEKTDLRKIMELKHGEDVLKDYSALHQQPTAGFHYIKTHIAESEARMQSVKAGVSFEQHFSRTLEERLRREACPPPSNIVKEYTNDAELILAKERVLKDTMRYLEMVRELLEKMLLVKVRHLKSATPLNLAVLGTDKDREVVRQYVKPTQPHGLPPPPHSFKDQILSEGQPHRMYSLRSRQKASVYRLPGLNTLSCDMSSSVIKEKLSAKHSGSNTEPISVSESDSIAHSECSASTQDQQMLEHFKKPWPPVWMSLAAVEQGGYLPDPQICKDLNLNVSTSPPRRRKSLSNILESRQVWADVRRRIAKSVDECLWREDKEKIDFFRVQFATLAHIPLSKPYPTHHRHMLEKLKDRRIKRQQDVIYDCELTEWYKLLVHQTQEEVGTKDEKVSQLLESIKVYFKMSATSPKFGKAKLALITMSLPAYVVCHIHVQRALKFILEHVLQAPEALLTSWLALRGLPNVLLKTLPPGLPG